MIPFNFHHLYYFFIVAELGSVSKAAQKLRISQPALSAQIKQFETYLNVKLFERTGRKLILTEEGRSAFAYSRIIFDMGREFLDSFQDRTQKGRLRIQIGVSNSIPKTFANALLRFILIADPDAHIILHEDTLEGMLEELKNHRLDLVLSDMPFQASNQDGIGNHLIGKIPIAFCAHPRLAQKYKSFPRQLDNAPMILPTSHSQLYFSVQEFFATHQIIPKIIAEVQDVELIHRMALDGMGIAPLNRFSVLHSSTKGKLVILDKKPKHGIHDAIYLIVKRRKNTHPLVEKILRGFRLSV
jgi:LysR family transcriptional activator of nhaA